MVEYATVQNDGIRCGPEPIAIVNIRVSDRTDVIDRVSYYIRDPKAQVKADGEIAVAVMCKV